MIRAQLAGKPATFVTVGVASVVVLAENFSRTGCYLVNTSTNYIYLAFGVPAVVGSGIPLAPWGSFWMDDFSFSTQDIRAIASGASSNLAIQEFV